MERALAIHPSFPFGASTSDPFLETIQHYINLILPQSLKEEIGKGSVKQLLHSLPILYSSEVGDSFAVSLLCPSPYTNGVGRFLLDTLSRWLVPGKNLSITGRMSLSLSFESLPDHSFYFDHLFISCYEKQDIEIIQKNLPALLREIKINIMAVYQARYVASLRSSSLDQKNLLIRENISKILNLQPAEADRSLFDQMQSFLLKVSGEEKMGQVKRTIAQLMQQRPKSFDREVFYEMAHLTALFKEQFASERDARHISRVIALHYLFKKLLLDSIGKNPNERYISLKVFHTKLSQTKRALGILVSINILRETERFDKGFLLNAVREFIDDAEAVKDSYICDRRDDRATVLYLEIARPQFQPFSQEEIKLLRQKLSAELKKQIESDVHPIFLPRNEEDVARNLILLSQQLKYSRDLPQVSIHYEKQSDSELFFSVLLTRLLLPHTRGLRDLILHNPSTIKFYIDEAREIGKLKRRIPKEAAILRVSVEKAPFFRPDYSVDLLRARQRIAYELQRIIGEFRDFNGGMILKQEEALLALCKHMGPIDQASEFILEDYFYSLRPGIMQTILPAEILQSHFELLRKLRFRSGEKPYELLEEKKERFSLFFIGASDSTFKERLDIEVEKLKLPSYELASCFLQLASLSAAGYILRTEEEESSRAFKIALERALNSWSKTICCAVVSAP